MDKIIISGLEVFAFHGVNPEEKENGQRFIMDITAYLDLTQPCGDDDIISTVSYAKMAKRAAAVFAGEKNDLIERAAQRVCDALLSEFEKIDKVTVLLKKPDAPVKLLFDYMAVEITRER